MNLTMEGVTLDPYQKEPIYINFLRDPVGMCEKTTEIPCSCIHNINLDKMKQAQWWFFQTGFSHALSMPVNQIKVDITTDTFLGTLSQRQ